jgi:hypothetical protein
VAIAQEVYVHPSTALCPLDKNLVLNVATWFIAAVPGGNLLTIVSRNAVFVVAVAATYKVCLISH